MDANWPLVAATAFGVALVAAAAVLADVAGLTGLTGFVPPLVVGVVVAAGIRIGYA